MLTIVVLPILAFFSFAAAQTGILGGTPLFDNTTCVTGPNTTFTNCNTFYSTLGNCTSNTTTAALVDCECKQSFFDLIIECKSELRVCTGNNTWDATLDPLIGTWHSVCDSASGVKPTSPVLSTTKWGLSAQTSDTSTFGYTTAVATSISGTTAKASGVSGSSTSAASTAVSGTRNNVLLSSSFGLGLGTMSILLVVVVL